MTVLSSFKTQPQGSQLSSIYEHDTGRKDHIVHATVAQNILFEVDVSLKVKPSDVKANIKKSTGISASLLLDLRLKFFTLLYSS